MIETNRRALPVIKIIRPAPCFGQDGSQSENQRNNKYTRRQPCFIFHKTAPFSLSILIDIKLTSVRFIVNLYDQLQFNALPLCDIVIEQWLAPGWVDDWCDIIQKYVVNIRFDAIQNHMLLS